jgi:hypothetical protein
VGVDGVADATLRLQEVMSKAVVVFLAEPERLRSADPSGVWG